MKLVEEVNSRKRNDKISEMLFERIFFIGIEIEMENILVEDRNNQFPEKEKDYSNEQSFSSSFLVGGTGE